MRSLLISVTFLLALLSLAMPASSQVTADNAVWYVRGPEAKGGVLSIFYKNIEIFRQKRIRVVLSGSCASACTLYTALLKDGLLCARSGTQMVFHQPFYMKDMEVGEDGSIISFTFDGNAAAVAPQAHNRFWLTYPMHVRREILKRRPGGLPAIGRELYVPASALGIPTC